MPLRRYIFATAMLLSVSPMPTLGDQLLDGLSAYTRGDYLAAIRILRPQADQGDGLALHYMGAIHHQGGPGVLRDYLQAFRWFSLAAEKGLPVSQYALGVMLEAGHGVPQDFLQAYVWFSLAATHGSERAAQARDRVAERLSSQAVLEGQRLAREWFTRIPRLGANPDNTGQQAR